MKKLVCGAFMLLAGLVNSFLQDRIIPRMKHMGRGGGCGGARRCNDRPAANLRGVIPVVA